MVPQAWTPSQRRVLIGLLSAGLVYLTIQMVRHRAFIPDPQPAMPVNAAKLADRLDPNVASESELAALPTMGEKRAAAIVSYRDEYVKDHPGETAFTKPTDLLRIKGIGMAMLTTLEPYFIFPGEAPATQPQ